MVEELLTSRGTQVLLERSDLEAACRGLTSSADHPPPPAAPGPLPVARLPPPNTCLPPPNAAHVVQPTSRLAPPSPAPSLATSHSRPPRPCFHHPPPAVTIREGGDGGSDGGFVGAASEAALEAMFGAVLWDSVMANGVCRNMQ